MEYDWLEKLNLSVGAASLKLLQSPFLFIACMLLFGVPEARACSCMGPNPVCSAYAKTDVLFVGKVLEIVEPDPPIDQSTPRELFQSRLVRLSVNESFRGDASNMVSVLTGRGGGDCGYPFKVGETYLVYASKVNGSLQTGICSRTRPLDQAVEDLEFLHSLSSQSHGASIFGTVALYTQLGIYDWEKKPMNGIPVKISGPLPGQTVTDAQGNYNFHSLPSGTYEVNFVLPEGYLGDSSRVAVADKTCAQVDEYPKPDGEISGRVLDENGKPVTNVSVNLRCDSKLRESSEMPFCDFAGTDENGHYAFRGLPPGTYVLGVNIAFGPDYREPFAPTYYSNCQSADCAQPISLSFGQHFTNGNIQLPAKLIEREIPIVVMWPNGTKAEQASLTATSLTHPDFHFVPQRSIHNPDAILLFEGQEYRLGAFINLTNGRQPCSDVVAVVPSAQLSPVKLVITHPEGGCGTSARK